jgi:error-prone DNA polymerase
MYTELQVTTNFSFLRGASEVEELFAQAAMLGFKALAVTDRGTVAGIVRAHLRAKEVGIRLIPGCRLDLTDAPPVLVYPIDRTGWSGLCRLLTLGKGRAGKGGCMLAWADLAERAAGLAADPSPKSPAGCRTSCLSGWSSAARGCRTTADHSGTQPGRRNPWKGI